MPISQNRSKLSILCVNYMRFGWSECLSLYSYLVCVWVDCGMINFFEPRWLPVVSLGWPFVDDLRQSTSRSKDGQGRNEFLRLVTVKLVIMNARTNGHTKVPLPLLCTYYFHNLAWSPLKYANWLISTGQLVLRTLCIYLWGHSERPLCVKRRAFPGWNPYENDMTWLLPYFETSWTRGNDNWSTGFHVPIFDLKGIMYAWVYQSCPKAQPPRYLHKRPTCN